MRKGLISRLYKNHILRLFAITVVVCSAYMSWISHLKFIEIARLKVVDTLFSINYRIQPKTKGIENVVLISIDDDSIRVMKMRWPWPRGVIAEAIKNISAHDPRLICLDLVFFGESADKEQDRILAAAIKDAKNVYAAAYFGKDGKYVAPDEFVSRNVKALGIINKPRDADNAVRRMRPFMPSTYGDSVEYALPVKVASDFLNKNPEELVSAVPLSKDNTTYLHFSGKRGRGFTSIPFWKVFKGQIDSAQIKGKMVFVGATSEIFHDTYPTPMGIMPGVSILINETLAFVANKFFRYTGYGTEFLILFIFAFIAIFCGLRLPVIRGIFITLSEVVCFFAFSLLLFLRNIIIDPFNAIFLVVLISLFLYGNRYIAIIVENVMLRREAALDGLTQLYLYRYLQIYLKGELKRALRARKHLVLVIYDLDHFKNINDTYGHEFGNTVLKRVAKVLKTNSRKHDKIARYGGEEFCTLMPDVKRDEAVKNVERIRNQIKEMELRPSGKETLHITISAGLVTTEDYVPTSHVNFVRAADAALYRSKNSGRDRVSVFDKDKDRLLQ